MVEAAKSFVWHRFFGLDGDSITMDRFGASAPGGNFIEKVGFTIDNVASKANALMTQSIIGSVSSYSQGKRTLINTEKARKE